MSPRKRLRLKDPVASWETLEVGTRVHRYHDGDLLYDGKEVEVLFARSDTVEFAFPEDVGTPGEDPVRVSRKDYDDPRQGNQFTRA
jgi:hypothetical protein